MHSDAQFPIGRLRRSGGNHVEATSHTIHRWVFHGARHPCRRHEGVTDCLDFFEPVTRGDFLKRFYERLEIAMYLFRRVGMAE